MTTQSSGGQQTTQIPGLLGPSTISLSRAGFCADSSSATAADRCRPPLDGRRARMVPLLVIRNGGGHTEAPASNGGTDSIRSKVATSSASPRASSFPNGPRGGGSGGLADATINRVAEPMVCCGSDQPETTSSAQTLVPVTRRLPTNGSPFSNRPDGDGSPSRRWEGRPQNPALTSACPWS
jgi:hypothetical protein